MKKLTLPVILASSLLLASATSQQRSAEALGRAPQRLAGAKGAASAASVADVVNAANTFMASLTAAQRTTLVQTFNSTNVTKWSNLPVTAGSRLGLQLSTLTAAQQALALAVVQAATGTVAGDGYNEVQQIRAADDNLVANGGGNGYGSGIYLLAFLGTPSTTGTWMLQFGGHHLATNITYSNGNVTGASPKFEATEPLTFTTANANVFPTGTACAPLSNEASALVNMLNGLSSQKSQALLNQTFSDVVLGPNANGQFPATKVGLAVSSLTAAQKQLVVEAIRPWVQDSDDATTASLMATYTNELNGTYIAYSGSGLLTNNADYVRIDGPTVWIEFVCQSGVIYRNQIHYHSIWRDHARDYGGNYYTTVTASRTAAAAAAFAVYPNPTAGSTSLRVELASAAKAATYTLRNQLGQAVATGKFSGSSAEVPTAGHAAGTYVLSVQADGQTPVTRKVVID